MSHPGVYEREMGNDMVSCLDSIENGTQLASRTGSVR